ncbi:MAG: 30S ribosome-binding factor RbfA [Eubacteriales bacterium]|nr:30S ribosome-binding factor RbfA [Eubacteriales bacterium]
MKDRINRINQEIKKELSEIIRELKDPRINSMTSVIAVDTAKDLRSAKVYISVLGDQQSQLDTIKGLRSASGFIRREIGMRLDLRSNPDLVFELDHSIEYGAKINQILHSLEKE